MNAVAPPPTPDTGRRRRRVWPWVVGGVAVLLAGAAVAADALARGWAEELVAGEVARALEVPAATPVDVRLGGGPVLLQALVGRLDRVEVRIEDLELGALTGDLLVEAEGVPLDRAQPTRSFHARYTIPEAALDAIADQLTGVPIERVRLDEPEIVAEGELSFLGLTVPLGLGLTPEARGTAIGFTPTTLRVGDGEIPVADFARDPFWGGLAGAVLQQREVCVADRLPAALTLTEVAVEGGTLRVELDASGEALGGAAFRDRGTCE